MSRSDKFRFVALLRIVLRTIPSPGERVAERSEVGCGMREATRFCFVDKFYAIWYSFDRERKGRRLMGIAALVLGIASVLCGLLGAALAWAGIVLGVAGIVLGALARREYSNGMATAGFVLSIIGTSLSVLYLIAVAAIVALIGKLFGMIV